MHTIGFTMLYVGYGAIVVAAVHSWTPTSRLARGLAAIGQHSYSIYLWHRVFAFLVRETVGDVRRFGVPFLVEVVVMTAGAIAVGVLMSKLIEIPVLAMRDRWFPSSTSKSPVDVNVTVNAQGAAPSATASTTT